MRYLAIRPILAATLLATNFALAQDQELSPFDLQNQLAPGIVGQFDPSAAVGEPATIAAHFSPALTDQPAILYITAQIAPGQHAYSLTQPAGGPQPTRIELKRSTDYRLLAPFQSQPPPKVYIDNEVYKGLRIEDNH